MLAETIGSFTVYCASSGRDVTPRGRKARALLAYLLSDPGIKTSKNRLSAMLWGDRAEAQARSSLRQVLLELRRALNQFHKVIVSDLEHIWLSAEHANEATCNARGAPRDAFEDLDHITPEFDDWLAGERSRRSSSLIEGLRAQAQNLLAQGLGAASSPVIERMRTLDVHNEDALRLGMESDFQQALPAAIAQRFEALAEGLRTEFGVEPSHDSRALRDRLLTEVTTATEVQFGSPPNAPHDAAEQLPAMPSVELNSDRNQKRKDATQ